MAQEEKARDAVQTTDASTDQVPDEAYRAVRKIVIAVGLGALGLALLVKYLVTGTVVRDGLGWAMLAMQIVFVVALPLVIFRPRARKTS